MRLGKRIRLTFILLLATGAAACSSISLPSLPWSSSAAIHDPSAEALFDEGMRYFNDRRYARAIDAFSRIKTDHPFSPQLIEAELKLADSYYLNGQHAEAIAAFKEYHALHPTNQHIPFVLYRIGQAHLDQFSAIDRDQKNTHVAKTYFERLITEHPNSSYAADAKARLVKTIEYLAEHDFNIALFYYNQEKYPAARDRFEEIVRRYAGTPTAVKSLFYLGESYSKEKNNVKAALAYEALLQHHPESKFADEAKNQLARLNNEKHDPLAMLLMRDRRPAAGPAPETPPDSAIAKLRDMQLIAKTDIVYEAPGEEKGFFRRVIDRINPFSSSGDSNDEKQTPPSGTQALARNTENNTRPSNDSRLVEKIDASLANEGIKTKEQVAAIKPPPAALPEPAPEASTGVNTDQLLRDIDSRLEKSGKVVGEITPPEPAPGLRSPPPAVARTPATQEVQESPATSGLLSSIDERLKRQGIEPPRYAVPVPPVEIKENAPKKQQPQKVELEPKLGSDQQGPLFLSPNEVPASPETPIVETTTSEKSQDPEFREIPRRIVKGDKQPQAPAATPKTPERSKSASAPLDEETKGVLDYIREDVDKIDRVLNPFRW